MSGARVSDGRKQKCVQNFYSETRRIQLGKPRRRWKDNLKTGFEAVRWEGVEWIYLDHDDKWRAVVNTVMNFPVP
jgi:hypothetical protein